MEESRNKNKRIEFLWSLATEYVQKNPSLSRFYVNSMRDLSETSNTKLEVHLAQSFCHFCGTVFQPNSSCTRIIPKKSPRNNSTTKKKNKRKFQNYYKAGQSGNARKYFNQAAVLCKTCGHHNYFLGSRRERNSGSTSNNVKRNRAEKNFSNLTPSTTLRGKLGESGSSKLPVSTPLLSKSAKRRRRNARAAQLKSLLSQDEETTRSQSSPGLKDFLSSLSL